MVDAYLKKQFDDDRRETRRNKRRQFFSNAFTSMKQGTSNALSNVKTGYAKLKENDAYKKASKFAINYELQERKRSKNRKGNVADPFAGFGGYEGYADNPLGNGKGRKKSGKHSYWF